jgi:tRNA uridine 5-carboxymethylaminomethyl modification enzyme
MLENTPNVDFYQDSVNELIIKNNKACGVITSLGHKIEADAVVITSGTFLNGIMHIGEKQIGGGRVAEKAATGITEQLVSFGLESDRLKTGTPPRVDGRSLDYSKMEEQKGDEEVVGFSYLDIEKVKPENQRSCHINYTDARVHEMLKTGFDRSPMYQGRIEGVGPRYCPSIEDKINRFAERERHQLFVEPEGWNTVEIYVNGFSTSLPEEVQYEALRMVPGFEKARMFRPGYAIEYDYFQPTQLTYTLETKALENLYFAGQINGTTGYEEAACQGIMAGMNAHLKINNQPPLILQRSEAYIGVLIDDLISKGTEEPYRMFTSRAEFRTLLRQDNADLRLTEMSYKLGLAKEVRMRRVEEKTKQVSEIKNVLDTESIAPEIINAFLTDIDSATISEKQKASKLLLRPNISLQQILSNNELLSDKMNAFDTECLEQAEIQIKYERYIEKEKEIVERMATLENKLIPTNFDYDKIAAISIEARQKFKKIRPLTLGQASRISGVNPSDVQILMVFMGR